MIFISTKVAIASSDGKFVNQHFGRAKQFLIVKIKEDGSYEFLERRDNVPSCNPTGESTTEDAIELISDVEGVLVSQVGPGAADRLIAHGIQPIIIPMLIEDAIKKVYELMQEEKEE
ncbi:NifB/NifX family molybdenum-iron cluster-binding protein [Methanobacterium sp.]|uniref:NifB/NifX family molybdenum-iron cluster-binding protein n=1 Tax=Methanobacterium sp. TaxID=2164 RepID=UPI003D661D7A